MNVEIVAAQFLFWAYLFRIFSIGSLQCTQLWYLPREVVWRPVMLRDDALEGDGCALLHPQVGRGEDFCPLLPPLLAPAPARRRLRFLKGLTHEMDLAF
jgi:hypothetical protein